MTDRTAMHTFLLIFLIVALTGAALLARTMWGHYRAVLHEFEPAPASAILAHPDRTGVDGLTTVAFRSTSNERIAGWYVPSRNRAAVIVTHGTNSDRSSMLDEVRILAGAGFGVLAFDWPGDGESEGEIRWGSSEHNALTGAIDWLEQQPDIDPGRLGAYGFSMGGYLVAQVAATDSRLRAVALGGAPTSFLEFTRRAHGEHGWIGSLPAEAAIRQLGMQKESDPPIELIAAIAPRPVLLLGGSEDPFIPPSMTRDLFARAGEPKELWIVAGARHGHYSRAAPTEYPRRISDFYASHLLPQATPDRSEGNLHGREQQPGCRNKAPSSCVGVPATSLASSSHNKAGSS